MKKGLIFLVVVLVLGLWLAVNGQKESHQMYSMVALSQDAPSQVSQKLGIDMDFGRMPVYFIANEGQMDERVAYYITGKDKQIYFTPEGVTFVLAGNEEGEEDSLKRWVVKLDFVEADTDVSLRGEDETGAVISYFKGGPEEWHTGISTYARLVYENLWSGIDLVYRGAEGSLKYEFVVHPGADPGKIRMEYRGASDIAVNEEGELEVETPVGNFEDGRPVAYQEEYGKRVDVGIEYDLNKTNGDHHAYGFQVGEYDRSQPLVLDPAVLIYCGYIGGSSSEYGRAIALDNSNNTYITGKTYSAETSFPVTVGPDLTHNDGCDVFVAKVKADGTNLVYCGYIGGSIDEEGFGIVVDSSGNAYVTGETWSNQVTFPVYVGPDLTHNGGCDVFVAKVNSTGTGLVYCGYIGGSSDEVGRSIAVDGSGNLYVAGYTYSTQATFPVAIGPDLTYNGGSDIFVAKINSDGTDLIYCGYIGGSDIDRGYGIAVDGPNNAYVTGYTYSTQSTFPEIVGPDLSLNGASDIFVAKVNSDGTDLIYCGYIGGLASDRGYGIAVDGSSNAYITGETYSTEATFPDTIGPDLTHNGNEDAFVAKVNSDGTSLIYCGYIGGLASDRGYGIAVDSSGNAYIIGETSSNEASFPVTVGPDSTYNSNGDAFVAKVTSSGTALVYCGYIGGIEEDIGEGIAVDSSGNAYISGHTASPQTSFPVTGGPDLTWNGGTYDAFVAKIQSTPPLKNDFNNDGQPDIVWRNYSHGANALWYLNSSGGAAGLSQGQIETMTIYQGLKPIQVYHDVLEAGEILYKDERIYHDVLDVAVPCDKLAEKLYWDARDAEDGDISNDAQKLMKPINLKAGVQAISVIGTTYLITINNVNWQIVGSGDFNKDGHIDILWRNSVTGGNALWYMNGSTVIGTAYLTTITDVNWRIGGTGDFNGDGKVDILWGNYVNGGNAVWYMDGSTVIGTAYLLTNQDVNWRIVGTGDFNGDGKVDILWRNVVNGENGLWYMNGSTYIYSTLLNKVADTNWMIEGAGDLNGDGKVDILWRNYSHGANAVWYMNGSAITSTEYLITIADVNWSIENH